MWGVCMSRVCGREREVERVSECVLLMRFHCKLGCKLCFLCLQSVLEEVLVKVKDTPPNTP